MKIKAFGGLLKRIGNFNMTTFKGRLIFQKTVYLIQAFGLNLGFKFNSYIHGPYSPNLAKVGYELINFYNECKEAVFVNEEYEKKFKKFLKFIEKKKTDEKWLEVASTLHMYKKMYPEDGKKNIIKRVKKEKDVINKDCEKIWDYLKKYELI